jgi:hypothetical protein
MLKKIIFFCCLFFLTSCSISSPLTTTQDFLQAIKSEDFSKASSFLILTTNSGYRSALTSDIVKFESQWLEDYGELNQYSVDNALPLSKDRLTKLNTNEGNQVYFTLDTNKGTFYLQAEVIKFEGKWKIIPYFY